MWYLHPGSGEFTRLKETLHWHILPEPARKVRTLKSRMNSIAKPSWPPGAGALEPVGLLIKWIFCLGTQPQNPTAVWKKIFPFYKCLGRRPIKWICLPMLKHVVCVVFFFSFARRCHSFGLNIGRQNHLMHEMRYSKKGTNFFHRVVDFCVLRRKPKNAEHCNRRCCCFSMLTRSSKTCHSSNKDTP